MNKDIIEGKLKEFSGEIRKKWGQLTDDEIQKTKGNAEVVGDKVLDEIENRKAQIRDIIIIILSSKTYEEVSTREGKENLRNEVKDTINSFLVQGKIAKVFFTEFIYN